MQDYHHLNVWNKAHALAIDVHRVAGTFPLIAARDLGLLEAATYEDLADRTTEVRRMLGGLIKKVGAALTSPNDQAKETAH